MSLKKTLIILVFIILVLFLLWKSGILDVSQIEIEKHDAECLNESTFLSEFKIKNENILFINDQDISKKILSKYICVKNIFFDKEFPNKLKVVINGRKGIAKIYTFKKNDQINLKDLEATTSSEAALLDWSYPSSSDSDTGNYIVDDEGIIFAQKEESNLPKLYIPAENQILKIGAKLEIIDFSKISLLFIKLLTMNMNFTQTKLNEHNLQILNDPKIVISLEKDILRQVASLQLILEKAKIDKRTMEIIDLRFDKPVVKYLPKK